MFLVAALGSTGTRWLQKQFINCGLTVRHDTMGAGMLHGIVGSPKWFTKFHMFDIVVHQVRHPLAYANTQVLHHKGNVPYPYGGSEIQFASKQDPIDQTMPNHLKSQLHIMMTWLRAMEFVEVQPEIDYRYRIEDMSDLGDSFKDLLRYLGFVPEELKIRQPTWQDGMTHNPKLGKPWEREALQWPDLSKFPRMDENLNLVKAKAKEYGYD